MSGKTIHSDQAPKAVGPYSQAVAIGRMVYCSGQIALDPNSNTLRNEAFETEVRQIFANIQAVTQAAGGSLASVVKLTVYMTDLSNFTEFNRLMAEIMEPPYPARAAIGVAELPLGASVEVDAILAIDQ